MATPHFEEMTIFAAEPAGAIEFETKGYPDGQELTVRGGTADAPVTFVPNAATYSVRTKRTLDGNGELRFKFGAKESKWMEITERPDGQ